MTTENRSETLWQGYEEACSLGRMVIIIVRERERSQLVPWLSSRKFIDRDLEAIRVRFDPRNLTENDVLAAWLESLALALEASAQINEFVKPKFGRFVENLDLFQKMMEVAQKGNALGKRLVESGNAKAVATEIDRVRDRHKKPTDKVIVGQEELFIWAKMQFTQAETKIREKLDTIRKDLGG